MLILLFLTLQIFKEVTEGLGCLLGGFCLAMWFLVLAPSGLIHSTSGRAILIAAFCVAAFSLSFSHYTRNYGLIACTSFAGAMITILGIDCFSRAGLKEVSSSLVAGLLTFADLLILPSSSGFTYGVSNCVIDAATWTDESQISTRMSFRSTPIPIRLLAA